MEDPKLPPADLHHAVVRLKQALDRHTNLDLPSLQSLPELGEGSDEATLRLIASLVHEIGPRHVIEFGCGVSTELLALLGYEHGRMAVTTFEHDPWAARELLTVSNPFAINYRWFAFCLCPLVARNCEGSILPVYDDGMTSPTVPFPADLLIITGPPRELGGRGGMIYQALHYARPGTILLLLHIRAEEETMLESWTDKLAGHLDFVPPGLLGRHLAFIVKEPMDRPFDLEQPRSQEIATLARDACPQPPETV